MKKLLTSLILMVLLSACGVEDSASEETAPPQAQDSVAEVESTEDTEQLDDVRDDETIEEAEPSERPAAEEVDAQKQAASESAEENVLADYPTDQIEYARVWLNFAPNPDAEQVYYEILPAGTPINAEVEGSAAFLEEVVQLSGGRRVDGLLTYSSNGDGTINLYNVPYSWDMNADIEDVVYIEESEKVLESIDTQYVEPLEDEAVVQMMERLTPVTE